MGILNNIENMNNFNLQDGNYNIEVSLTGGTGRATITTPTEITVLDGEVVAGIEWSSPNYDYMIVAGDKYLPVNTEGNSLFEIPVECFDEPIKIIADTTAMSVPHEIEYELLFDSSTLSGGDEANISYGFVVSGVISSAIIALLAITFIRRRIVKINE